MLPAHCYLYPSLLHFHSERKTSTYAKSVPLPPACLTDLTDSIDLTSGPPCSRRFFYFICYLFLLFYYYWSCAAAQLSSCQWFNMANCMHILIWFNSICNNFPTHDISRRWRLTFCAQGWSAHNLCWTILFRRYFDWLFFFRFWALHYTGPQTNGNGQVSVDNFYLYSSACMGVHVVD